MMSTAAIVSPSVDFPSNGHIEMNSLHTLLAEKQASEAEVMASSGGNETFRRYLDVLRRLNRRATGIVSFRWPTVTHPLYFRAGTSDLWSFQQIFLNKEYAFDMPIVPRRILDLGSYVGYSAVFFAERFRQAEIVCVEPSRENFRMLTLNTGGYSNVRAINAAVWDSVVARGLTISNFQGGDWGTNLAEFAPLTDGDGPGIQSVSLAGLMSEFRWKRIDLLKCDIEGAEKRVFEQSRELISQRVDVCAVEIHDAAVPGCRAAVIACFDDSKFETRGSGEFDVFIRRNRKDAEENPPRVNVLQPLVALNEIHLANVGSEPWAYHIFDGNSAHLHPTDYTKTPAGLSCQLYLDGHCRFESDLSVRNPLGHAVEFLFALRLPSDGDVILAKSLVVAAGGVGRMEVISNPLRGHFTVSLQTRMAVGSPTNHQAAANWQNPVFR